jgi:hypothetical protein
MKPISEMNLAELADALDALRPTHSLNGLVQHRLRELHELTRWISVSERMPTQEDMDVLAWYATKYPFATLVNWYEFPLNNKDVTRWQRITPPEDKP